MGEVDGTRSGTARHRPMTRSLDVDLDSLRENTPSAASKSGDGGDHDIDDEELFEIAISEISDPANAKMPITSNVASGNIKAVDDDDDDDDNVNVVTVSNNKRDDGGHGPNDHDNDCDGDGDLSSFSDSRICRKRTKEEAEHSDDDGSPAPKRRCVPIPKRPISAVSKVIRCVVINDDGSTSMPIAQVLSSGYLDADDIKFWLNGMWWKHAALQYLNPKLYLTVSPGKAINKELKYIEQDDSGDSIHHQWLLEKDSLDKIRSTYHNVRRRLGTQKADNVKSGKIKRKYIRWVQRGLVTVLEHGKRKCTKCPMTFPRLQCESHYIEHHPEVLD